MKKKERVILSIYIVIGISLITIGIKTDIDYYSTLILAMGFALTVNSVVQFVRFWHNTRPENVEKYQEKIRKQSIDINDERKVQLRNRSGYITWVINMIGFFIAAFIAGLLRTNGLIIGILFGIGVLEYVVAFVIYKYMCKNF